MEKIIMHCPMNISRAFSNLIREFIREEFSATDPAFEVYDEPHRLGSEDTLLTSVKESRPPALYIGHATDFGRLSAQALANNFEPLPDLPLGRYLRERGFEYERRYFHPITVIPFGVIYNKNLVGKAPPLSWQDFQQPRHFQKVRLPDRQRTISRVLAGAMKLLYPNGHADFMANCVFQGSPIEVVDSVDRGEYHYGMVNIAFSRLSRLKNTQILWLKEGSFCMPQVVAVGKGKQEAAGKIIDHILSPAVQDFFALQGFIPAVSGEIPAVLQKDDLHLIWEGWEAFFKATV